MRRNRWLVLIGVFVALLALGLAAAACGGGGNDEEEPTATEAMAETPTPAAAGPASIDTILTDYKIEPDAESVAAGEVTFNLENIGQEQHNLHIARTDLGADALPYDETEGLVDESQLDVVGASDDINPSRDGELTVTLEPGTYVLYCTIAEHYGKGMYLALTVE